MKTPDINTILNAPTNLKAGHSLVIGARPKQGRTSIFQALGLNIISTPHCPPETGFIVDTKALSKLAEKPLEPYIQEDKEIIPCPAPRRIDLRQ